MVIRCYQFIVGLRSFARSWGYFREKYWNYDIMLTKWCKNINFGTNKLKFGLKLLPKISMMTSSIEAFSGLLVHRSPVDSLTNASDAERWGFLWSAPQQMLSKQSRLRWFETPWRSSWRQWFFTQKYPTRSRPNVTYHYVIMGMRASQIISLTIVYSIAYSGEYQRKHQSSASLTFVRGVHRWPVNTPHKWAVTRKMFPFDEVIMPLVVVHSYCGCTVLKCCYKEIIKCVDCFGHYQIYL